MNEAKRKEIKGEIEKVYEVGCDLPALSKSIMYGYIFGRIAHNEHYKVEDIYTIALEVDADKNPLVGEGAQ